MAAHLGTALVTGASSGIGEVYSDRLARRGYDLVLTGRNTEKLATLARGLGERYGIAAEPLAADLAVPADLGKVEARLASDPSITLLVNSAGLAANGALGDANLDATTEMLAVNVTALTRLAAVAAKSFGARGGGAIINLASVMALIDSPLSTAYVASKSYVLNLTLSLDLELKAKGVQVQAVLPGLTRTAMIAALTDLPDGIIMSAEDMVDASLAGFDAGELVTIPSLESTADYEAMMASRAALRPYLSLSKPAARYAAAETAAA